MFFTTEELDKITKVLKDLNIDNKPNVVLIDARPKKSASKEDGKEEKNYDSTKREYCI